MAYKDESEYKTPKAKREYDEQWRRDHPGYHAEASRLWKEEHPEYFKEYREDRKENCLYIIKIYDEYYFGSTKCGMHKRMVEHFWNIKNGKGNPRMKKLFQDLGEDEFMNNVSVKVIKTFPTYAEAKAAEKLVLKIYVGQKECMNKYK